MKLLADECCDAGLVNVLRSHGHDVLYAIESLRGVDDDDILHRAFSESRVLLTEDKDFGELVYRLRRPSSGIILLRFRVGGRVLKAPQLLRLLEQRAERLHDSFVVLEADKVRIRPLE